MDGGQWTPSSRNQYNLRDAVSRCTTQVRDDFERKKNFDTISNIDTNNIIPLDY